MYQTLERSYPLSITSGGVHTSAQGELMLELCSCLASMYESALSLIKGDLQSSGGDLPD